MSDETAATSPSPNVLFRRAAAETIRTAIENDSVAAADRLLKQRQGLTGMSPKETLMNAGPFSLFRATAWDKILAADDAVPQATVENALRHVAIFATQAPDEKPNKKSESPRGKIVAQVTDPAMKPVTIAVQPQSLKPHQRAILGLLTPKQSAVMALVGENLSVAEIASKLDKADMTVRTRIKEICEKTQLPGKKELHAAWTTGDQPLPMTAPLINTLASTAAVVAPVKIEAVPSTPGNALKIERVNRGKSLPSTAFIRAKQEVVVPDTPEVDPPIHTARASIEMRPPKAEKMSVAMSANSDKPAPFEVTLTASKMKKAEAVKREPKERVLEFMPIERTYLIGVARNREIAQIADAMKTTTKFAQKIGLGVHQKLGVHSLEETRNKYWSDASLRAIVEAPPKSKRPASRIKASEVPRALQPA